MSDDPDLTPREEPRLERQSSILQVVATKPRIVIAGGSGQIGTILARAFHDEGNDVVVLSRRPLQMPWRTVPWDGRSEGEWESEIDGAVTVINMAGRSVNCRYTPENRRQILDSRLDSTRAIGRAIGKAVNPPRTWLQSGTATIYAHRYDAPNDEASGIIGGDEPGVPETWRFSIDVARRWEQATAEAAAPYTRQVILRSSMIMSPDSGGVFDTLLGLVRKGLGGQSGNGRQYVSWIHCDDFVSAIRWILAHQNMAGPVNVCSPNPLPNAEFMSDLRKAWGTRVGLPATDWMLELGAYFLKTETELVLKSRRVTPGRLMAAGFCFQHADWTKASCDLCRRWREKRGRTH